MYVDSVYGKTFKEIATLVSPMTTVPISGCLSFQYQRSQERGNMFSVFTRDSLGQYQELWNAASENQSDWSQMLGEWTPVQVDLKAPYSVQVRMKSASYATTVLPSWSSLFLLMLVGILTRSWKLEGNADLILCHYPVVQTVPRYIFWLQRWSFICVWLLKVFNKAVISAEGLTCLRCVVLHGVGSLV